MSLLTGPHVFGKNLKSKFYRTSLENDPSLLIEDISYSTRRTILLAHDGRYERGVINFLNDYYLIDG